MSVAARDIDAYLADLPEDACAVLTSVRAIIKDAAPDATESISYQIPTFSHRGMLVSFAAWKSHWALYPVSEAVIEACGDDLRRYDTAGTKATIRFPYDKPPPAALLTKIIRTRIKENEARAKARAKEK